MRGFAIRAAGTIAVIAVVVAFVACRITSLPSADHTTTVHRCPSVSICWPFTVSIRSALPATTLSGESFVIPGVSGTDPLPSGDNGPPCESWQPACVSASSKKTGAKQILRIPDRCLSGFIVVVLFSGALSGNAQNQDGTPHSG